MMVMVQELVKMDTLSLDDVRIIVKNSSLSRTTSLVKMISMHFLVSETSNVRLAPPMTL